MENFENWNKNVRKKNLNNSDGNLNSNKNTNLNKSSDINSKTNSNTNLAQNTDKNNNQRDYDKEPLIIKDYSLYVIVYFACFPVIIFMVSLIYDIKIGLVTIAFLAFGIQDLQEFIKNKDKISVKFTNTSIAYMIDKTTKITMNLNDITDIIKTIGLAYGKNTIDKNKIINKQLLFLGIGLILIVWLFLATKFLLILLSLILLVVLFINFLSNLFVNKTLSLKFWKEYKIFDNNHRYVNFVIKNSDYSELKTYFLLKTGKNLDDIKISINYPY